MELKWLEDLVCVTEKGHFARAASERFVTQSALSRRIQSLESWVGTKLLDRSEHPIKLTAAGEEFIKFAREIINGAYEARSVTSQFSKIDSSNITVGCLHTLAMSYVPNFVKKLQDQVGAFSTTIVADTSTFEEYLTALNNGTNDLFICYGNSAFSLDLDKDLFPRMMLGRHWVRPYQSTKLPPVNLLNKSRKPIPYLQYSSHTYMIRVVEQVLQNAPFKNQLKPVYRASIAESLFTATQKGLGISWLPEVVVSDPPEKDELCLVSEDWSTPLEIYIYKSIKNPNPTVAKIWSELESGLIL